MSLTGPLFSWTLWIVAAALFGWVIYDWPRSASNSFLIILRRIGYQFAVILTVLIATVVSLNSEYSWYSNWEDLGSLFGAAAPGNVVAAGAPATDATGGTVVVGPSKAGTTVVPLPKILAQANLGLAPNPGAAGQYKNYLVVGPVSGVTQNVTVWFPPSYTEPKMANHRYPVMVAFFGVPGAVSQLTVNMALGKQLATAMTAGTIADSIILMPNFAPHNIDTECLDGGKGYLQMETFITKDVTDWAQRNLRVGADRGSWATFGFSAGAWCASMLTMLHPDIYSAAISLGGYFQPTFTAPYLPFAQGSPQWDHYDLLQLAHDKPPMVALWVQTSKADPISYGTAVQLLNLARPPMSVTADVLPNAGHRFSIWVGLVPQTLKWLGSTASGFHR